MHSTLPSQKQSPQLSQKDFQRALLGDAEREAALKVIDRAIENKTAFDRYGGQEVEAYEKEFAAHMGTRFATAVSSGTAAVHTCLAALNLEPGSEVICPPITDQGGIGPVLAQLCIPIFADTDPETFNVTAESIENCITPQTRAIVVAHIAGEPCDMEAIMAVAEKYKLPVIEDAAQAHDATWLDRKVGSFGTLGAFSLMNGKHHTSGGQGGMVVTNDEALYWRAKSFADRGKNFGQPDVGGFMGLNYRMTELEAGIGRVQLRRLPEFIESRRRLAGILEERLKSSKLFSLGYIPEQAQSAFWFLRVRVHLTGTSTDKEKIIAALQKYGVLAAPTYTSIIYEQTWFKDKQTFGSSEIPWSLPQCQRVPNYTHCAPNSEQAMANHMLVVLNESLSIDTINRMADAMLSVEKELLS
ncbi:MAG: DegT/DnrJ/EryC1/StrS family aminotransferase [Chthoniobacterales bacterium]